MFRDIRKSSTIKLGALMLAVIFLVQITFPTTVMALTGGPSQPEVNSFTPIGTTDMVDPFTGGFNYNIPLIDVGGYPINLAYNGAPNMDTEASWVGLGWNINPGVINRSLRGIPDDFNGDEITQEMNIRDNITIGTSAALSGEVFGFTPESPGLSLGVNFGINYNNYSGLGITTGASMAFTMGEAGSPTGALGISATNSSTGGLSISPSISFSATVNSKNGENTIGGSIGTSFNSRQGLAAVSMGGTISGANTEKDKKDDLQKAQNKRIGGNAGRGGVNASSSISLLNNTYVPTLNFARVSNSISGSFKLGGGMFGFDADGTFTGFFSSQGLAYTSKNFPAYGFMFEENGAPQADVMLDFNREKQRAFNRTMPALHTTNHSYDLYSISGQGVSGMFRPFRSEVGYVHDNNTSDISDGTVLSFEISPGQIVDIGAAAGGSYTRGKSGNWTNNNPARAALQYKSNTVNDPYEPYYFKNTGEINVDENLQNDANSFLSKQGGFDPVRIDAFAGGYYHTTQAKYVNKGGSDVPGGITGNNQREGRAKRNQVTTTLTKADMDNGFGIGDYVSDYGENHHIGEMTILQSDGSRYVYGVPLYNTKKQDVSFNITKIGSSGYDYEATEGLATTGTDTYTPGTDNSKNNERGRDWYFNRTTVPAYAHSYLLTSVLSHDYIDRTGNGLSADDYGNYTDFEYGESIDYKWRVPFKLNTANYSEGLKTDPGDDRGSYVYGEKELKYLKKIETKTHVAIFASDNRQDGREVAGENGGLGTKAMQKLNTISLYSRSDYYLPNGTENPTPTPIKEVHFEYDYSLCKKIPNTTNTLEGKLTLKRVYFTYGNSFKGELSDYQFRYGDNDHNGSIDTHGNPDYDFKAVNGWGTYMPQRTGSGIPTNSEFPYVHQDDANTDDYVGAWALTSVLLPSGGRMDIELEAKDYGYVQDKEAMQMVKIYGCGASNVDPSTSNELYSAATPKKYLYVEFPDAADTDAKKLKMFKFLDRGEPMYYRFFMDLTNSFDGTGESHEYVEGYLSKDLIDKDNDDGYGICSNNSNVGWIRINGLDVDGDDIQEDAHPISKSTWQFARANNPRVAFDQTDPLDGGPLVLDILVMLGGQVANVVELFTGPNGMLQLKGYGKKFTKDKSWIRLNTPEKKKKGGGYRVKSIKTYDNWEFMTDGTVDDDNYYNGFQYGQEYTYQMADGSSSGVATYEPMGCKDNPVIQPKFFSQEHLLVPDDNHYMEGPYGESFFPSPSVGHRRVEVKNLQYTNVGNNATGKIIHEFYTSLDYPVRVDQTELFAEEKKPTLAEQLLGWSVKNYAIASQGFVIETNDMHGKPKGQYVYGENQNDYISGMTYVYDQNFSTTVPASSGNSNPFQSFNTTKLNNNVAVITPEGTLGTKQIGIDFDMINDFGETSSEMEDVNVDFNTAAFLATVFPFFVPTVWASYTSQETRYRYASTTKVINRFGILRTVVQHDLGASVAKKNLAWDSETGEVLLTEVTNQYGDAVYDLKYPAHWAYSGMGPAYQNIGMNINITTNGSGEINTPVAMLDYLHPGDEIALYGSTNKYWVDNDDVTEKLIIIDNSGALVTSATIEGKIIRSGHRNMQTLPIATLSLLQNPLEAITGNDLHLFNTDYSSTQAIADKYSVIQASAVEYDDNWPMEDCDCDQDFSGTYNKYRYNSKGTWRMKKSYAYLQNRTQDAEQNTRENGVFNYFRPFWTAYPTSLETMTTTEDYTDQNPDKWTWTSEVTNYSPYGYELENKDALDRKSAAQYDYNNNLPVAVGNNAEYRQIGFDSFEEYDFDNCVKDHFSFEGAVTNASDGTIYINTNPTTESTSHTGKKSIVIPANSSIKITKKLDDCPQ